MLEPYRRHIRTCPHRKHGQNWTKCQCPIWAYGDVKAEVFRRTLGTRDWQRALRRIDALETGVAEAEPHKDVPSLKDAAVQYLADCESRGLEESTRHSYQVLMKHLDKFAGNRRVDALDTTLLTRFRNQRKIMASTMRKETENLKSFFIFCVGQGWIATNPARGLKCPEDKSPGALPFDRAEMKIILAAVDKISNRNPIVAHRARVRARALILAALWTGLRISDLAQLRRSQYDENSGYLTLRHTQKTKVPIRVKLRQAAVDALRALPVEHPDLYFWSGSSDLETVCTSLQQTLGTISRLAGIHVHAHRFRDTFASELLLSGADLRTVQLLLGHKSIKTTEKHYAHFVLAHQVLLDNAVEALDLGS